MRLQSLWEIALFLQPKVGRWPSDIETVGLLVYFCQFNQ